MKNKIKHYTKEILKTLLILTIILNIVSYYKSSDLNKEKLDINTFSLLDGKKYQVKKDKPLIIHFWATWCPTCKFENSNIQRLSNDYEVLTIAVQSGSKKEIQKYLNENNLSFKVVNDDEGKYAQKFNIQAFPTTLIYDKDKNLTFSEVGYTSTFGLYLRMFWLRYFS
ncbi:MAG: redoxin domain-containing protein [Arcobacter sp.]|nr:redoxin domain-containing protein [Arcobacter sp.]